MSYGIHWFRRDLRIHGNPALNWNRRESQGKVLGLFCFDKKFLARPDFSVNRFQFFLATLKQLRADLVEAGGDLLTLDVGPDEAFEELLTRLRTTKSGLPHRISFNRDYEPFAVARDQRLSALFKKWGVESFSDRDHLVIEPDELFKPDRPEAGYQVFTPFSRRWLELFRQPEVQVRVQHSRTKLRIPFSLNWKAIFENKMPYPDHLEHYAASNARNVTVRLPPAGVAAAAKQVEAFKKRIDGYGEARDFPDRPGTSGFSIYFKNGSLTVAEVIDACGLEAYSKKSKDSGRAKFLSELIWREFYYHILARHPYVETRSFLPQYAALPWENDEKKFNAWKEGRTGFPIVDAGMRQLNTTGWMHNRVRMIVASFLVKDLLVNWQWGERYFMVQLLDGDLAPNNGGWQWGASTGCDPQPYFRIFNPTLQGLRFDPTGDYVRKYVPELRDFTAKQIYEPTEGTRNGYPAPIVDHAERKELAIELFTNVREKKSSPP